MVNKQLADWIKTEEAQGYTEVQLRKYLEDNGYKKRDIEEAIKLTLQKDTMFSLIKYIKSISIPIFLAFILSFVFLSYYFDKLSEGLMFFVALWVLLFIIDFLYKKNKDVLAKWIGGLGIVILIVFCDEFELLQVIILFVLVLIHSLAYFFKSKKEYSLESIFLSLLISLTFSLAIVFLVQLIYAYGIFALIGTVQTFSLIFIMMPIYVIFIASYSLISTKLLTKALGKFDYNAYFRFKHFPFTVFNLLSSKEENLKKSIVKSTVILSGVIMVIILVIAAILGVAFVSNTYSRMEEEHSKQLRQILYSSHDRYEKLIELKGFNKEQGVRIVKESNGKFFYVRYDFDAVKTLFYNCDANLNCEQKPFDSNQKIENQFSLKGVSQFRIAENKSEVVIFLVPSESYEELFSHNVFEFEDTELQSTKISSEINNQWQSIHKEIIDSKVAEPKNWQEKLSLVYTGKAYEDIYNKNCVESSRYKRFNSNSCSRVQMD